MKEHSKRVMQSSASNGTEATARRAKSEAAAGLLKTDWQSQHYWVKGPEVAVHERRLSV
jgi:hypothetical protein